MTKLLPQDTTPPLTDPVPQVFTLQHVVASEIAHAAPAQYVKVEEEINSPMYEFPEHVAANVGEEVDVMELHFAFAVQHSVPSVVHVEH